MTAAVLFIAGAQPVRLPATEMLYVVKLDGAETTVESDGPMRLVVVKEVTVEGILAGLQADGLLPDVARVACIDEQYVLLAAKLREALELPGQSVTSARAFRNKLFMKDCLRTADSFRLPRYWSPLQRRTMESVLPPDWAGKVVKKPILGSGAMEVRIFDSIADVDTVEREEMLESFVDLPMLHIDGLLVGGDIRFFVVSKYINFCLSFTEFKYVGSEFSHDPGLNRRAETAMREVFQLLPSFRDGAFHLEMFYADDELFFCEVASRPGGIAIVRALEEAYGINLERASFLAQCGITPELPSTRRAETSWLLVPHGVPLEVDRGRLERLPWLVEHVVAEDQHRDRSRHCADGKFKAVLRGNSLPEVAQRRAELLSLIGYA